jgi:hypothetical protein
MEPYSEMQRDDVITLLAIVPERVGDVVGGLDEARLRYRHGPAFPSLKEVIAHLSEAGSSVDSLLRHVYLDGADEAAVRATIDPAGAADTEPPAEELLQRYSRVRRRTVDLLRGLSAGDWARTVRDPQSGELTLLEGCSALARHEIGHLGQIRNLVALLPEARDLGPLENVKGG